MKKIVGGPNLTISEERLGAKHSEPYVKKLNRGNSF